MSTTRLWVLCRPCLHVRLARRRMHAHHPCIYFHLEREWIRKEPASQQNISVVDSNTAHECAITQLNKKYQKICWVLLTAPTYVRATGVIGTLVFLINCTLTHDCVTISDYFLALICKLKAIGRTVTGFNLLIYPPLGGQSLCWIKCYCIMQVFNHCPSYPIIF